MAQARHPDDTIKMMESIVAFNEDQDPSDRIKISLDLEKLQTENISLSNCADVVILGKDFATLLDFKNKIESVHSFRKLTKTGLVLSDTGFHKTRKIEFSFLVTS